jgi:23S rRNA C2498 (ribose-2'-O)-methylase RlmM
VEATAREASQTAAREKAALEAKLLELESDLRTATTDLAMMSRQFSQATNQLRVVTEEASRLQNSNAKLSQVLTVKFLQPSHEFTLGVDMSFIPYPLVLTPLV